MAKKQPTAQQIVTRLLRREISKAQRKQGQYDVAIELKGLLDDYLATKRMVAAMAARQTITQTRSRHLTAFDIQIKRDDDIPF